MLTKINQIVSLHDAGIEKIYYDEYYKTVIFLLTSNTSVFAEIHEKEPNGCLFSLNFHDVNFFEDSLAEYHVQFGEILHQEIIIDIDGNATLKLSGFAHVSEKEATRLYGQNYVDEIKVKYLDMKNEPIYTAEQEILIQAKEFSYVILNELD